MVVERRLDVFVHHPRPLPPLPPPCCPLHFEPLVPTPLVFCQLRFIFSVFLFWIFRHCSLCSAVWLVLHHFLTNYSLPEITGASCLTSSKALLYNRFLNNLFTSVDNPPFIEPAPVSQICKMWSIFFAETWTCWGEQRNWARRSTSSSCATLFSVDQSQAGATATQSCSYGLLRGMSNFLPRIFICFFSSKTFEKDLFNVDQSQAGATATHSNCSYGVVKGILKFLLKVSFDYKWILGELAFEVLSLTEPNKDNTGLLLGLIYGMLGAYLIFVIFLHMQNFWRIKFTPKSKQ